MWIIIWSRVLRDQVQVFVALKCPHALSWTLCLGHESPSTCSPEEVPALWAWEWHCGKNWSLSSLMQLLWRTRTAPSFLSWNFTTVALGGKGQTRQIRDIYPGCLALLPHLFLIPYLGNTNSFQDSTLYPNLHKHDLPSLCWWSWKMTALGWTIWNCHLYTSTVVECRQFNLMVIIYFWEYSLWSTFTSIISLILRTEMWGRGYWLSFIDEKIEAHKTHPEFAFVPFGGYL